jgi:quercetin dioxygenase-like cupin family protein
MCREQWPAERDKVAHMRSTETDRTSHAGSKVLVQAPGNAERLGQASLRVAIDDIYLAEYTLEPGTKPGGPHYHARHADSFYVLEGELEFVIDGRPIRAKAGTMVVAPRGAVHAFPVAIGGPARFLNMHTPGGFEKYIRELTGMRARGEEPTAEFFRSHDIFDV